VLYARSRIVVAARAAGREQPIDGPWLRLRDLEGLRVDSVRARGLGFQGRIAIHPDQVEVLNQAFGAVSEEQVRAAQSVVTAFEDAERQGLASIQVSGQFVDYPIYARAQRVLALHAAAGGGE
jgi:citrate lyase subunit beta / citryl-CoA lyase